MAHSNHAISQGRLAQLLQESSVTGAAVAVLREGEVEVVCAGVRDAHSGEAVDQQTVFDAASLSKPMVAYAVLQLADAGVLDLDAPLAASVPPVVPDDPRAARITLRHLLTHTGGLQNLRGTEPLRTFFEPGAWFSYSSVGFGYLQTAVQAATGEPLDATLRRLVFEPLTMSRSSFEWQDRFAANVALPHENGLRHDKHLPRIASASYSLQTTARDYAAFVAAVLAGGRLQAATRDAWLRVAVMVPRGAVIQLEASPAETERGIGWGLGWGVEPAQQSFFQWGKMTGARAFVLGSTREAAAVVLLTNCNRGLRLMQAVAHEVLPGPHPAIGWLLANVTE
jgi:CubicO group peptidase (beta-lactamase class C family)